MKQCLVIFTLLMVASATVMGQSQLITGVVTAKPNCSTTFLPKGVDMKCPEIQQAQSAPYTPTDPAPRPEQPVVINNSSNQPNTLTPPIYRKPTNTTPTNTTPANTTPATPAENTTINSNPNGLKGQQIGSGTYVPAKNQPVVFTPKTKEAIEAEKEAATPPAKPAPITVTENYQYKTKDQTPVVDPLTPPPSFHYNKKLPPTTRSNNDNDLTASLNASNITNPKDLAASSGSLNDPSTDINAANANPYGIRVVRRVNKWNKPKVGTANNATTRNPTTGTTAPAYTNNTNPSTTKKQPFRYLPPATQQSASTPTTYNVPAAKNNYPAKKQWNNKAVDNTPPTTTTPTTTTPPINKSVATNTATPPPTNTLTPVIPVNNTRKTGVSNTAATPKQKHTTAQQPCNCPTDNLATNKGNNAEAGGSQHLNAVGPHPDYKIALMPDGKYQVTFSNNGSSVTVTQFGRIANIFIPSGGGATNPQYNYRGLLDNVGSLPLQYTYEGRVLSVGNTPLGYNYNGNISSIGNMPLSYNYNGTIDRIGNTTVQYDANNTVTGTNGANPNIGLKQ